MYSRWVLRLTRHDVEVEPEGDGGVPSNVPNDAQVADIILARVLRGLVGLLAGAKAELEER